MRKAALSFLVPTAAAFLLPLSASAFTIAAQPNSTTQITSTGGTAIIFPVTSGVVDSFSVDLAGVNGFPGTDATWQIDCYTDSSLTVNCPAPYTFTITLASGDVIFDGVKRTYTTTNISPSLTLDVNNVYVIGNWPSNHYTLYGTSTVTGSQNYSFSGTNSLPWNAITFPFVYSTTSQAIAASSSLWESIAAASSTINCSNGNLFSDALCSVGTYLFIPNPTIVDSIMGLPQSGAEKFPFSWYAPIADVFSTLTASSTSNMATLSINFAAWDPATSTAFGPILPNAIFLGTSTILKYVSQGTLNVWLFMESCALWVLFGFHQYWMIKHKWLHH